MIKIIVIMKFEIKTAVKYHHVLIKWLKILKNTCDNTKFGNYTD